MLPQSNSKQRKMSECKRWNSVYVIYLSWWWREKDSRERGVTNPVRFNLCDFPKHHNMQYQKYIMASLIIKCLHLFDLI